MENVPGSIPGFVPNSSVTLDTHCNLCELSLWHGRATYVKVKVVQLCLTLCGPIDYTVHGIILQARILEWVAFPSPGDLPKPGIKPRFPAVEVDSLPAEPQRQHNMIITVLPKLKF